MKLNQIVFGLILLIATVARLAMLLNRPDDLRTDPDGYVAHAQMMSDGFGFAGPYTKRPTAFRPPGYSVLIAWWPVFRSDTALIVATIHIVAGVLTVLLTRQLAEDIGLSTPVSNLAAALVALDPLLIRYSALPMTEVVSALSLTAALVMACRYRQHVLKFTPTERMINVVRTSLYYGLVAGCLFGLSALIRPIGLVSAVFVSGGLFLQLIRQRSGFSQRRPEPDKENSKHSLDAQQISQRLWRGVVFCLLPLLAMAVTLSPWILRNWIHFHAFIPATTHGGYTLFLGNNAEYYQDVVQIEWSKPWDGDALTNWQQQILKQAREQQVPTGDEVQLDRWMYHQAMFAIRSRPADFISACLLRMGKFWSICPGLDQGGATGLVGFACGIWYGSMWLLVMVSLVLRSINLRQVSVSDLWLTIAAFMLMHTFYWTDTRMRAPIMPLLCVQAAMGAAAVHQRLHRRS